MSKNEKIGKRIAEIRKQLGFTQSSVAKYLHVDQSLISYIEKNERKCTVEQLKKLSYLFGVPVSAFEEDSFDTKLVLSFRKSDFLTDDDMDAISTINRIALNCDYMQKMIDNG